MLAKKYKLPHRNFAYLLKKGQSLKRDWFGIKWLGDSSGKYFGIILSKKVYPKATARNYLKRKIFDLAAKYLPASKKGLKVLVRIFKAPNEDGLAQLEQNLKDLFA